MYYYRYPYPQYVPVPMPYYERQPAPWNIPTQHDGRPYKGTMDLKDYGSQPYVINIEDAAKQNNTFRTALWTGKNLQVTVMSIGVGEDIGLEIHPDVDQFLRIEEGQGMVQMGERKDNLTFQRRVYDDYAIMVPAGVWHNLTNTGNKPLKLYTIYAPPEHPFGTIHRTKAEAMASEKHHDNDHF
ncbi:cupin domain-containing protein [Virgibacillus sediminis]|uniref:Cupin domain-containing protein n=1 Tax=Virgibacillus sediminis TaxID=202260 RepID=A0ABV7A8P1_9BACI